MNELEELIYAITPVETPFVKMVRYNRRRLGRPRSGMRAIKRRIAKAPFKPAHQRQQFKIYEWVSDRRLMLG
jgi:hypothetical protein